MKKYLFTTTMALFGCLIFLGCKKSNDKPATTTTNLSGYCFGNFNTNDNEGELFKSDGTTVQYVT